MADLTTYDPLFLALFSDEGASTELSGSGYARLSITNDTTTFDFDGGTGDATSKIPLAMAAATADWLQVKAAAFYDTSTGGTQLAAVQVAETDVLSGQHIIWNAGDLGYTAGDPGAITPAIPSLAFVARSLYLYENKGIEALSVLARSLYPYVNEGVEIVPVLARSLYLDENRQIEALSMLARSLFAYEEKRDGEVSPWLMKIVPNEQYRGGQIGLYGDGFGEILQVAQDAAVTVSSIYSGSASNVIDETSAEWQANDGESSWVRLTFPSTQTIVGVALEGPPSYGEHFGTPDYFWGKPRFRFSDAGADVDGTVNVPIETDASEWTSPEYPVGAIRQLYTFPARSVDWIEVRVVPGSGNGTHRGLREIWVYTDTDQAAESSSVISNLGLPEETLLGIVTWQNRSPGLWPANVVGTISAAALATIPNDAESGLVYVQEAI